jgi:1,2-dihydroxy-3-keto-5-methylthiopentene dioxygenase
MSILRVYADDNPTHFDPYFDFDEISRVLKREGIQFERWTADQMLPANASQDEILAAYQKPVQQLMQSCGFATADVISVNESTPNIPALRQKFLDEHTHSEDEARFFVDGSGLFFIHTNRKVHALLCERGDFIDIPPFTKHWFDMGATPFLKCIRTFTTPEGWVADYTGSDIASKFPRWEAFVLAHS